MKRKPLVLDLTRPLGPGTQVYPGDPPLTIRILSTREQDGYYNRLICMTEHAGTHIDAPAHFAEGPSIDAIPPSRLIAPAAAVKPRGNPVTAAALETAIASLSEKPGRDWWLFVKMDNARMDATAAELLTRMELTGIAVDTMSPDEEPYPVHRQLLPKGILIAENVRIPQLLIGKIFTAIVAPLPIEAGSGAPARIYALLDGAKLGKEILMSQRG